MVTSNISFKIKQAKKRAKEQGLDSDAEITTEEYLDLLLDLKEYCVEFINETKKEELRWSAQEMAKSGLSPEYLLQAIFHNFNLSQKTNSCK